MIPQTELENYKLQVELLQEKLKRSEERRQQLQEKLENMVSKRNEHERLMKAKSRLKYQQFIQEQRERNDRNKALIRALENIDQQAAALTARSERLKILKVQYELYFNKILQFRTMRNGLFNYNSYDYHPTIPIGGNLYYTNEDDSPKPRQTFTHLTADVGNFECSPELDSYRHAATNVLEDTIVSPSVLALPRQKQLEVNSKSNVKDLIATTAGISSPDSCNQSAVFADTRIPIDSNRYSARNSTADGSNFDGFGVKGLGAGSAVPRRSYSQSEQRRSFQADLNETHRPTRSYDGAENHERVYTLSPERETSPTLKGTQDIQNQPFMLDKLHSINRDETLGKLLAKLYDNGDKKDGNECEKSSGKSQPRFTAEGKNISVIKDEIIDSMESRLTSAQMAEKVTGSNMSSDKAPTAPSHNGRMDKFGTDYFPSIKKKEKLSIETIENAIYGERISPGSLAEGKLGLERKAISESLKIDLQELSAEMNSIQKDLDVSAEPENVGHDDRIESFIAPEQSQPLNSDTTADQISDPSYTNDIGNILQQEQHYENNVENQVSEPIELNNNYEVEDVDPGQYVSEIQFSDSAPYQYQDQQQSYDSYQPLQTLDQAEVYDPNHNQGHQYYQNEDYAQQPETNYNESQNMQQSQYLDQNYAADQNYATDQNNYNNYEQNFMDPYSTPNYGEAQLEQQHTDPSQTGNINDSGYDYNQPQQDYTAYDPNAQMYSDPQYEQQTYQEVENEYISYTESEQLPSEAYVNEQPGDSASLGDSGALSASAEPIASYQEDNQASFNASLDEHYAAEGNAPPFRSPKEDTQQQIPIHSEQPDSTKLTSILASNEKTNEQSPVATKNKKKKRVIFAENEPESNSSRTLSTDKPESQSDGNLGQPK